MVDHREVLGGFAEIQHATLGSAEAAATLPHTVRLLELPDLAIELIDIGRLTKGHGKALLTEPDHERRRQLALATRGWQDRPGSPRVSDRRRESGDSRISGGCGRVRSTTGLFVTGN